MVDIEINKGPFLDSLERIQSDDSLDVPEKNDALFRLVSLLIEDLISFTDIQFTTGFSQIVYLVSYYQLPSDISRGLHLLRRRYESGYRDNQEAAYVKLHDEILRSLLSLASQEYTSFISDESKTTLIGIKEGRKDYIHAIRGSIVMLNMKEKTGVFINEYDGEKEVFRYDVPGENDIYTRTLESFFRESSRPFLCQFIHVNIESGTLVPRVFILDPDHLVDVTAISESFKGRSTYPGLSFLRKFQTLEASSVPLLVGNIVNMLFDEIISQPSLTFDGILSEVFRKYGMLLCLYDDDEVKNILSILRRHFDHLSFVVNQSFKKEGIQIPEVYTEPSYYSVKYGLQGRLDLLHENDDRIDIIELKSGSPYMSNTYGLSTNHYVQCLLYDLMVESTARKKKARRAYILYSKVNDGLKYAPAIMAQQMEALDVRNSLVWIEHILQSPSGVEKLIKSMTAENYKQVGGYTTRDVEKFQKTIASTPLLEYHYFVEYTSFVAREQKNNKTGSYGRYADNGLSNIWTLSEQEKEERFSLMKQCTIASIDHDSIRTTITLKKSTSTNTLSNFRVGDIVVLYPYKTASMDAVRSQIFKSTLVDINQEYIKVQLRGKVYNKAVFETSTYWSIEPDILDSSFGGAYRSLYGFLQKSKDKKSLILGVKPPRKYHTEGVEVSLAEDLTTEQVDIASQAIASKDYYLVWGPPGTGKTSKLLRSMVASLYENQERVLVLAYTNKAVDEICEAIASIGSKYHEKYYRVGSLHGCGDKYKDRLLDEAIRGLPSRKEILALLGETRIIVGTVSSVINRPELFRLIPFSRLIVDEASQILEPMLVNLLARIPRWVLIGDHRQLPAVVTQSMKSRSTDSDHLKEIGIEDLGLSLFERLYRRCLDMDWHHAVGMLSTQGRMHKDISLFPSTHFYGGKLKNLPLPRIDNPTDYLSFCGGRLTYVDIEVDDTIEWKTNIHEAQQVVRIIELCIKDLVHKSQPLTRETIGVITPYRAQIALVKSLLYPAIGDMADLITVDTVERYQGGARDIILFSVCSNNERQFDRMVNMDDDGIDRKLNVALTRAKEQLILLGNKRVLSSFPIYKKLMQYAREMPKV